MQPWDLVRKGLPDCYLLIISNGGTFSMKTKYYLTPIVLIAILMSGCATVNEGGVTSSPQPITHLTQKSTGELPPNGVREFEFNTEEANIYLLFARVEGGASFGIDYPEEGYVPLENDEDEGIFAALLVGTGGSHSLIVRANSGGEYQVALMEDKNPWAGEIRGGKIKVLKEDLVGGEDKVVAAVLISPGTKGRFMVFDPKGNIIAVSSELMNGVEFVSFKPILSGKYRYMIEVDETTKCIFATPRIR